MAASSASTSELPQYRIKRKPAPTIDVAEMYPNPDPADPFAPLWVLRNRTSSLLGQNPMVSPANPSPFSAQAAQNNEQPKPTTTPSVDRRRSNSYLSPETSLSPPRRASPTPGTRSGSPSPSPRNNARQGDSSKPKVGHYRPHSQLMLDGFQAPASKPGQHIADVSSVTAATVGIVPPTRDPRPGDKMAKSTQSKTQRHPFHVQKPSNQVHHVHIPLQNSGHVRRPTTADGPTDGSGTETDSDASIHAVTGAEPPSAFNGSKIKSKSKPKSEAHGHRSRTVSPSPLRHGGSTNEEGAGNLVKAGSSSQPRQQPTPDTTVTTSSSSSGASRFARFLVHRKSSNDGTSASGGSGYMADAERRRGHLRSKHRGTGGKVAISAPIASSFVHHQGSSDFGRASSEDERGMLTTRPNIGLRQAESDSEIARSASSRSMLADFPSSKSISRRPSPLPPHMADMTMNATMANSFDGGMGLGVLLERSFEMSDAGIDLPEPEPPKTSRAKPERHNTEMSWNEVNAEDYDYFSRDLAANSTMVLHGTMPSPPLPPLPPPSSLTPPPVQRTQPSLQRTSDSDLYPTPAPSPAPSLNEGKEKAKCGGEVIKNVTTATEEPMTVTRTHIHRGHDEEKPIHNKHRSQEKAAMLPTPPLTAHAHKTSFLGDGPTATAATQAPAPAPPPKITKRRLSSSPSGQALTQSQTQHDLIAETNVILPAPGTKAKGLYLETNNLPLPSAHSMGNTPLINVSISTPLAAREDQETKPREEDGAYVMPRKAPRPPKGQGGDEKEERKDEERERRRERRREARREVERQMSERKAVEEGTTDGVRTTGEKAKRGEATATVEPGKAKPRTRHVKSASTSTSAPAGSRNAKAVEREGPAHATCTTSVSGPILLPSSLKEKEAPPLPHPMVQSPQEMSTSASKHWHTAAAGTTEFALPTPAQLALAASLSVYSEEGRRLVFGSLFEARKTVVIFIRHFWCHLCQDYMSVVSEVVKPEMLVSNLVVDDDEAVWVNQNNVQEKIDLIIISNGAHGMISKYRQMFKLPFSVYTDPTLALYKALGMVRDGSVKEQHHAQCHSDSSMMPATPLKDKRRFYSRKRGDSSSSAAAMGVGVMSDREGSSCSAANGPERKRSYVRHGLMSGIAMVVVRAIKVGMPVWEKGGDVGQLGGEFVFGPGLTCTYAHRMQTTKGHAPIQDVLKAAGVQVPSEMVPVSPPTHRHTLQRSHHVKGRMQSQSVDLASPPKDVNTPSRRRRESMKAFHVPGKDDTSGAVTAAVISSPTPVHAHSQARKMARRDSRRHEGSVAIPMPVPMPAMMSTDEEEQWMEERHRTYDKIQEKKNVRRVGALGRTASTQGSSATPAASVQLELRLNVAGYGASEGQKVEKRSESHRSRGLHNTRPVEEDKVVYHSRR